MKAMFVFKSRTAIKTLTDFTAVEQMLIKMNKQDVCLYDNT